MALNKGIKAHGPRHRPFQLAGVDTPLAGDYSGMHGCHGQCILYLLASNSRQIRNPVEQYFTSKWCYRNILKNQLIGTITIAFD